MLKLTYNQLYTFYILSQSENFSDAAKKLHISTPAVSMQMKKLEEYLGFNLFNKKLTTFTLTKKAEQLLPVVKEMFHAASLTESKIEELRNDKKQLITIGTHLVPAQKIIPNLFRFLKKKLPTIEFKVVIDTQENLLYRLHNYEIDFMLSNVKITDDIVANEAFIPCDIVYAVCTKSTLPLFTNSKRVKFEDINKLPVIMPPKLSVFYQILNDYFEKNGIAPNIIMEEVASTVASELIINTDYGAFFGKTYIERELREGKLKSVSLECEVPSFMQYFCYIKSNNLPKKITDFVEIIRTESQCSDLQCK